MTPGTLRVILDILAYYCCVQIAYCFLVLVMGKAILNKYERGVYENPRSLDQRLVNFCIGAVIGIGPFLNKRFMKYPWIVRKILMLLSIIILMFAAVVFYYIVKNSLEMIFL